MAFPKRKDEFEPTSRGPSSRPRGPVLVPPDESPPTATAAVLSPPPRVPPGITATDLLPDPTPEPDERDDLAKWLTPPLTLPAPPYFTFQASQIAIILSVLIVIVVIGLLASALQ
jgi:hypothetical protein